MTEINYKNCVIALNNPHYKPPQPPPWKKKESSKTTKEERTMSETVTIKKKAFDSLQENNLDLMDKLEKAKKTLRIYAARSNWDADYTDSFCCTDGWEMAQDCLKEIEE